MNRMIGISHNFVFSWQNVQIFKQICRNFEIHSVTSLGFFLQCSHSGRRLYQYNEDDFKFQVLKHHGYT